MKELNQDSSEQGQYREMTVAHIREQTGTDDVKVVFLESARFYRLLRNHPAYGALLARLQDALAKGCISKIRCAAPDGDVIEDVQ